LLLEVLGSFERPGEAVDLGCGAGIDTLAMLERGWRVFATDAEEEAVQRTRDRVPPELEPHLQTLVTPMEDVDFPTVDLIWASFSLFFCDPARFVDVWSRIGRAVVPRGRFAGQLLGDRDTWAPDEDISSFSEAQARALFDGWTLDRFEEEENDGSSCDGPKHWHVFHVVAKSSG
jgi:SAM-dependent methyltransferase